MARPCDAPDGAAVPRAAILPRPVPLHIRETRITHAETLGMTA